MPDPATLIMILGGGLVAAKVFGSKEEIPEQRFETSADVGANADTMGYDRITTDQALTDGVAAGEVAAIPGADGKVTTVVGLGNGDQLVQHPDGSTSVRSSGEPEIDAMTPVVNPSPIAAGIKTAGAAVAKGPPTNGAQNRIILTKPRAPVTRNIFDARVKAAARRGLVVPM
jgi:hypothetical protein